MKSLRLLAAALVILYAAGVEAAFPWPGQELSSSAALPNGGRALVALLLALLGVASLAPRRR